MDNTQKFNGKAQIYSSARPAYPKEVYEILYNNYGFASCKAIADIGAGTGKFTEGLARRGSRIYAVEPNSDMYDLLAKKMAKYPSVTAVKGQAENTGLKNSSIDAVTVAQAFHWFSQVEFKKECLRISGGCYVVIIYNSRISSPLHEETAVVLKKYCPAFKGYSGGIKSEEIYNFYNGKYKIETVDNTLYYTERQFIERCLSSSYALKEADTNYTIFCKALQSVFINYAEGGVVQYPHNTKMYIGLIE